MKQFSWRRLLIGLALAAGCMLVGATIPTTNQALGEVSGRPEQPMFTNGSVPLLREISATLRQMDGRLARLETLAQKIQAKAIVSAQRAEATQRIEDANN
jgi:TolA-binding protein